MTAVELAAVVNGIAPAIKTYVAHSTKSLAERIAGLESRAAIPGPRGEKGDPGGIDTASVESLRAEIATLRQELQDARSSTAVAMQNAVDIAVAKALATISVPKDGRDGRDVDHAAVDLMVSTHVQRAVAALPVPVDGKSVGVEDVAPLIEAEVRKAVASIPPVAPPVGVKSALIDRAGHLIVTLTDGSAHDAGEVVGKDGKPGEKGLVGDPGSNGLDGKDGAPGRDGTLENLKVMFDGERTLTFCFKDGTPIEGGAIVAPWTIHRGLFVPGKEYDRGDAVTWGGSTWTATAKTKATPGESGDPSRAWVLSAQRGREGKVGKKGDPGERGPRGEVGPQGRSAY